VLSLISSTIYIGSAVGGALGGVLLANFSISTPPYVAGAITGTGLVFFLLSIPAARRQSRR